MSDLLALLETLPDYAKDIKLNMSSLLNNSDAYLSAQQVAGVLYAAALATQHQSLSKAAAVYAGQLLTEKECWAVKAAASIMAMNNMYYRFTHVVSEQDYAQLPARLRMNVMANPGVAKVDFELYSLAVSIINGCGLCMDTHTKGLTTQGLSKEAVQTCARIAAVINALAQTLNIQAVHE